MWFLLTLIKMTTEAASISSDRLKEIVSNNQWVIDSSELEYTLKLGSGSSGKVYKGMYLSFHTSHAP